MQSLFSHLRSSPFLLSVIIIVIYSLFFFLRIGYFTFFFDYKYIYFSVLFSLSIGVTFVYRFLLFFSFFILCVLFISWLLHPALQYFPIPLFIFLISLSSFFVDEH